MTITPLLILAAAVVGRASAMKRIAHEESLRREALHRAKVAEDKLARFTAPRRRDEHGHYLPMGGAR